MLIHKFAVATNSTLLMELSREQLNKESLQALLHKLETDSPDMGDAQDSELKKMCEAYEQELLGSTQLLCDTCRIMAHSAPKLVSLGCCSFRNSKSMEEEFSKEIQSHYKDAKAFSFIPRSAFSAPSGNKVLVASFHHLMWEGQSM